jgi:AraC family transcriptional regulator
MPPMATAPEPVSHRPVACDDGAYGALMASHLRPDAEHPIDFQTLRKSELFVTRLRCETGLTQRSTPFAAAPAFIVSLQLRDMPFHELWLDDVPVPTGPYPKQAVSIVDLERRPTAFLPTAFDCLQFHLSRAALDRFATEHGCPRVATLHWPRGSIDAVTDHLGRAFLPALARPKEASKLFLDHATLALISHFTHAFGGVKPGECIRGGLAPWQERRAKDFMRSRLENDISLGELAAECRLSRSYFARAFKRSTGESPHRWLLGQRVETAKQMLLRSETPLSEVAVAVGFSDQSHLTKVFSRAVGATPGAWRRGLRQRIGTTMDASETTGRLVPQKVESSTAYA